MSNCQDIPMNYQNDAEIEVKDMIYEKNSDGFADTVSGKFLVHVHRDHRETEFVFTIFKCAKGTTGICAENPMKFTEALTCKRFRTDATGPWHVREYFYKFISFP